MVSARGLARLATADLVLADSLLDIGPITAAPAQIDASHLTPAEVAARLSDAHARRLSAVRAISGPVGESIKALDEMRELLAANVPVEVVANAAPPVIRWSWKDHLPMAGRRIAVTRAREMDDELTELLVRMGAEVISAPTLEYLPPSDPGPLDRAIEGVHRYETLVLTSAQGVNRFVDRLIARGKDTRWCAGLRIAAIGPGTQRALLARGLRADILPEHHRGEALAQAILQSLRPGGRVLLARAQEGREVLPLLLTQGGALVDVVPSYRSVLAPASSVQSLKLRLEAGTVDAVTLASGSAVRNLITLLGGIEPLARVRLACLGPVTAEACVAAGLTVAMVSPSTSFAELVEVLAAGLRK
jgi:uroporphyrinogen III methyltransferase/synthase